MYPIGESLWQPWLATIRNLSITINLSFPFPSFKMNFHLAFGKWVLRTPVSSHLSNNSMQIFCYISMKRVEIYYLRQRFGFRAGGWPRHSESLLSLSLHKAGRRISKSSSPKQSLEGQFLPRKEGRKTLYHFGPAAGQCSCTDPRNNIWFHLSHEGANITLFLHRFVKVTITSQYHWTAHLDTQVILHKGPFVLLKG